MFKQKYCQFIFLLILVKNIQQSKVESIAHILIPQLNLNLEQHILDKMTAKALTLEHLAIAPMISYE